VRREAPTDTEAPAGKYMARTIVNRETVRKLGAARITSFADLAAATRYLYRSAVERVDAVVTDQAGKPLAVIGDFKGALTQASVYPSVLVAEAVRVPGAARVWLSHNHPSGTAELSNADEKLAAQIRHVFTGTGIEVEGIIAVAGDRFGSFDPRPGGAVTGNAPTPQSTGEASVPVIERELADGLQQYKPLPISSPTEAKQAAAEFYRESGNKPGILLTDAQHRPAAYVPIPDVMQGMLKGTGGLRALYRAVSEANAGAAIIVHGGELSHKVGPGGGRSVDGNIAAALRQVDVRVLDIIDPRTNQSKAERGTLDDTGAFWSVAALTAAGAVGALAGPEGEESE
jgi:DNA repair protein RadC